MTVISSLIKKEMLHIVRDRRTMVITLVMPMILLLLFGFAISTEVNDVRVVAVADTHNDETRELLEKLSTNSYFSFAGIVAEKDAEPMLRRGKADAVIFLRNDAGKLHAHITADASNPTSAQAAASYLQNVVSGDAGSRILITTMYNPQMKSAYNFVPGIMGMIFILICAIMTSVSIVSEKENGTLSLLLVSPVRPQTIIFGKLIPYFMLSCVILAVMLLIAYTVLGLPVSYTVLSVIVVTLLYVALSLSIGLLVSAVVSTRLSALIVSAVLFMLPVIMLSGMIFPIDNMPEVLQWLSCAIPARWYISAMRKLMIQQLDFGYILGEFAILCAMTAAFLTLAVRKFKT